MRVKEQAGEAEPVINADLCVDVAQMVFHRLFGYFENFSDISVLEAVKNASQNVSFPSRQPVLPPYAVDVELVGQGILGSAPQAFRG